MVFSNESLLRAIHQLVNPLRGSRGVAIKAESAFIVLEIRLWRVCAVSRTRLLSRSSLFFSVFIAFSEKNLLKYFYDTLINCFN